MPRIGNLTVSAILDPLPALKPASYQLLRQRPGMEQRAVLFDLPRYEPVTLRTWDSAPSAEAAKLRIGDYEALRDRRQVVTIDDGVRNLECLVLGVIGTMDNGGSVVGGRAEGDSWLIQAAWEVLPL